MKTISVFLALFVSPLLFINITDNPFYAQTAVLVISLCLFFGACVKEGKFRVGGVDKYFVLFLCACVLSGLFGIILNVENRPAFYYYALNAFTILFACAGGYFLGTQAKEGAAERMFNILFGAAGLSAVYLILQAFNVELFLPKGIGLTATFGNANFFGGACALLLPAVMFYFLSAQGKIKYYYGAVFTFMFGALALSNARSSWLAFLFAVVFLLAFKTPRALVLGGFKRLFLACAAAALIFMLCPQKVNTYAKILEPALKQSEPYQSRDQRLMMYAAALQIFKERPVFGAGAGAWRYEYAQKQGQIVLDKPEYKEFFTQSNAAHNLPLQLLAETGVLGAVMFGLFLFVLFGRVIKTVRKPAFKTEVGKTRFLYFLSAGALTFLVDNMLNITFFIIMPAFLFWFTAGLLAARAGREQKEVLFKNGPVKFALYALLFVIILFQSARFTSEVLTYSARQAMAHGQNLAAERKFNNALKFFKGNIDTYFYLGLAQLNSHKNEAAYKSFCAAARVNPAYEEALFNKALTARAVGKRGDFGAALRLNPYNETAKKYSEEKPPLQNAIN